jgi:Fe-S cluster assembly protein SufD
MELKNNMDEILDLKNWYIQKFEHLERNLNGVPGTIHSLRREAISYFSDLKFPSLKDEDWKYTNIAPLLKYNFKPVDPNKRIAPVQPEKIQKFLFDKMEHSLLVFINGHYSKDLSNIQDLPNDVIVSNISSAISDHSSMIKKHFGKYADHKNQIFTALSTAFIKDGVFVYIPDGKIIEHPIHILFLSDCKEEKLLIQPRNLFVIGKNSQASIIEHYTSFEECTYFTNTVTEVVADENAVVDHIKLQEESKNAFHIARMEVDQERSSNFTSHLISTGGNISRNDFNTRFNNEGGECMLNGLFLTTGTQLFDIHSMIDHAKPHCNSHEHYKGILDDKSRGVFNGKVMVRKDAQKTNAFQENNNIILSDSALINTKPQLEIFADDVKCSHGATIGQLDSEAMFYLKSRGIGEETARTILIRAFASDVIKSIKINEVRNYLEEILNKRFNN